MTQEVWERYRKADSSTGQSINSRRLLSALKLVRSRNLRFSTKVIERIARIDQRGAGVPGAKIEMVERQEEAQTVHEGQGIPTNHHPILVMVVLLQWAIRT